MTNPPPITPDEIAEWTACAHLRVMYDTEEKGGHTVGHWECDSCAGRFIPLTVAQREHIDRLADVLTQEHAQVTRFEAIERAARELVGESTRGAMGRLRAALGREEAS